jgi:hypothetical protein
MPVVLGISPKRASIRRQKPAQLRPDPNSFGQRLLIYLTEKNQKACFSQLEPKPPSGGQTEKNQKTAGVGKTWQIRATQNLSGRPSGN